MNRALNVGRRIAAPSRQSGPLPVDYPAEVWLVPGPVELSARVRAAGDSRRSTTARRNSSDCSKLFAIGWRAGGCRDAALFLGSGTLANEVVAATLAATVWPGRGLILDNGEFGRRLVLQAAQSV